MERIKAHAKGLIDAAQAESMAAAQIIPIDMRAAARLDRHALIAGRGVIVGPLRFKIHAIASDQSHLSAKSNDLRQCGALRMFTSATWHQRKLRCEQATLALLDRPGREARLRYSSCESHYSTPISFF